MLVRLPVGISTREGRLLDIHRRMLDAKASPEALVAYQCAKLSSCVPGPLLNLALSRSGHGQASAIMVRRSTAFEPSGACACARG
jgi:hypothetical protein